MTISEKITIFITVWIIILLFITRDVDLEIYFVLILLGFFFIVEFTDQYITTKVKKRLRILIYVFVIIFIIIASIKITSFL